MMNIPVNKYQTPITEELYNSLPEEVQEQLVDYLTNVEYIQRLISPDRPYAKDLPRDKKGRIIVDITNPHILEDMDYFRPTALHFKKHGRFTNLKPNANPNSEYGKWIREERRRCWQGYVRPSDGEWVTGHLYFYLNYCPILISLAEDKSKKKASRIEDFPRVWEGIYLRFHYMYQARNGGIYNDFEGGNHGAELAARGKSKSYSMASVLTHNFILGEDEVAYKDTISLVTAYQKEYLTKDGVLNKFIDMADFCADHTQFPRRRLRSVMQEMTWKMGYKDVEKDIERGSKNTVMGISSKDDQSKLRGKRAVFIGIEEFGTFPRLIDLYNVLLPSVQDGDYVFGLMYLHGTSGDKESDFYGAQEIMYNPKGYNMYALPNVYDKTNQGKKHFVFFFPGYMNREGNYDHNGVSDVTGAIIKILMHRYHVKYNSSDPNTILRTIAEHPITPAEAIIKVGVNLFPIIDLTERLLQIDNNPREFDEVFVGELVMDSNNEVKFTPSNIQPIRDFPHKDNKLEGAVEIFKLPEKDKSGKVFGNRYILGCDTYDDDASETLSLGSIFVLDLWTDQIVAEFTGRPMFADDFYEIARRLCLFYNGRMNYENNKKGLFSYFAKMQSLYLLTDVLDFLKDKDMIKGALYGNKQKGTNATAAINNLGRTLQRAYLLRPITQIQEVDGELKEVSIPMLYTIKNRALIKEYLNYNTEGNFDRISAMGMLMLLREDRMIAYGGNINPDSIEQADSSYLGNDPFFMNNYDRKLSKMYGINQ